MGIRVTQLDNNGNGYKGVDVKLLNDILANNEVTKESETHTTKSEKEKEEKASFDKTKEIYLYLSDLRWFSQALGTLRSKGIVDVYLNDLLETCSLELPKNAIIERNPELEARCQKLRLEQQNLEYRKMTKDVDATLKNYPEDTIAYQMKAINSQLVAVLQFIFSVAAGFAFGFIGIQLIVGNLDFGLRLLLGIMIALIIALAEIYFLAKKLNEYDNTTETVNKAINKIKASKTPILNDEIQKKLHVE
uniref:Endoplasmic reticulum-based factor for assembly of V-ATPase n=1 Tax=Musca domestica TaxID=7370 RepID=T1P7W4_MUSDO